MYFRRLFVFLCTCSALACGDDPETFNARFPVESGIVEKRVLDSLSSTEARQLCRAGFDSAAQFFESDATANYLCTLGAALSSSSPKKSLPALVDAVSCESLRQECLTTRVQQQREGNECAGTSFPNPCRVSVGEYQMCLERYLDAVANEWQAISCQSLARQPLRSVPRSAYADPSDLPGCERLVTDCPGIRLLSVTVNL